MTDDPEKRWWKEVRDGRHPVVRYGARTTCGDGRYSGSPRRLNDSIGRARSGVRVVRGPRDWRIRHGGGGCEADVAREDRSRAVRELAADDIHCGAGRREPVVLG